MNLILLVGFVMVVAGTISRFLIDACTALPIDTRPLPLPPAIHSSATNAVPSSASSGTILTIVTNAEYLVEADVERSTDLVAWQLLAHLSIVIPEQAGATGSASFSDGEVSGTMTASLSTSSNAALPGIALQQPRWTRPHPPAAFYRIDNFGAWRNVYYTVEVSSGPGY